MKIQDCKKIFTWMSLIVVFMAVWNSSAIASGSHALVQLNLHHGSSHSHHDQHCVISNPQKDCVFKSIALPSNAFQNASQNEIFVFNQHNPNTQTNGFSWISWGGGSGLLPMLNDFSKTAPSTSYKNPYDPQDKTPNVNDWMYSAYVSELENIDLLIKFKLLHTRKEIWIPLWKAQSSIDVPQPSGLFGWLKKATCWIGLLECNQRAVYQIGGYAVVDVLDAGFSYQNGKKVAWVKVAFKGFKHCFNTPPTTTSQQLITPEDQVLPVQLKASDLEGQPLTYTVTKQPSHGVLSGSNGTLLYTPNLNYFGIDDFSYVVSDGIDQTAGKVSIEVTPVNDAPVAQNQQLIVKEDYPLNLVLTGTDVDSANLSYTIQSQPLHGKLIQVNGQYQYLPNADYFGEDSFRFSVSDGEFSANGLIQITVQPINDAPSAQSLTVDTAEDTSIHIQLEGSDLDADFLVYTITTKPQHGILVGFGQSLQYIPHPNYFGKDEFAYSVDDGQLSNTATVKINVLAVNDLPVVNDIELIIKEDEDVKLPLPEFDLDGETIQYEFEDPRNKIDDFIWISNSGEGTISKINVDTGIELARYRTGPTNGGNPSRNAVDLDGSVWVGNRANNTITKIGLVEKNQCIDRNGNGVIETSTSGQDVKNWTGSFGDRQGIKNALDECILMHIQVEKLGIATPTDIRMVTVDKDNNVIVGGHNVKSVFKINGYTGEVIKGLNTVGSFYGGFADKFGRIWAISRITGRGVIIRIDTTLQQSEIIDLGQDLYGIALDNEGVIWSNSLTTPAIVAYDPQNPTNTKIFNQVNRSGWCFAQGMVLNKDGDIYIAGCLASRVVGHYKKIIKENGDFDLKFIANYDVGDGPTGVAIDKNGSVWASNYNENSVSRIDFNTTGVTIRKFPVGVNPYNYSDMTGYFLKSFTSKITGKIIGNAPNYIYQPALDFNGSDTVYYKAYDKATGQYVSGKILIKTVPVNDAPEANDSVYVLNEDSSIAFDLIGTDKETATDQLTFSVTKQPDQGVLQGSGKRLIYKPNANFNGTDTVQYTVSDGQLNTIVTVKFNVKPVADAPVADNQTLNVLEDNPFNIKLIGLDADNDPLVYTIIKQPTSGTLVGVGQDYVYTPKFDFNGVDFFDYKISDGVLSSVVRVTINVTAVNDAPIAKTQNIEVRKNKTGSFVLSATDVDSSALLYQVMSQPAHGKITGTAPNLVYTPDKDYVGSDVFEFAASDLVSQSTASIYIQVVDTPNRLPEWKSIAPVTAEVGQLYQYNLQAIDPDQDELTYSLSSAPVGMTLNGKVLSWIPQEGQAGTVDFAVIATDTENGSTAQNIKLTVKPANVAPVIQSQAKTFSTAGKLYTYQVRASDANADTLSYSLENAPSGMSINATTGLLQWNSAVQGQYDLVVKVSDGRWLVSQRYTLTVDPAQALSLNLSVNSQVKNNQALFIKAIVGGSSANTQVRLLLDGAERPLDNNYQASFIIADIGVHQISVTATEGNQSITKTANVLVLDGDDVTPPQVSLIGLDDLTAITKPLSIRGEIADQTPTQWSIELYDTNSTGLNASKLWSKQGQGNINGELAQIDPTQLVNGVYTLSVRVVDTGGNVTEVVRDLIVDGKMKIGELAFTLEDAVIPMPSLDVSLQRSYDSRQAKQVGDFGYGWRLGVQQMKMRQSRPIHTGWETYMKSVVLQSGDTQLGTVCVRQVNNKPLPTITVTLPDGNVEAFQVELDCVYGIRNRNTGEVIQGNRFPVVFKAKGDTQSRFNLAGESNVSIIDGRWTTSASEEVDANGNVGYLWYVPNAFNLQTQAQMIYEFNTTQGISKIIEPTGNTLTITPTAITHSSGKSIVLNRDSLGRITSSTLPDNTQWQYEYDAAGDLTKATAPNAVQNVYVYDANHRLLSISDQTGTRLTGYEYDADGRLIAMLDANGARIEMQHDLAANTERVTNANGFTTTYVYDDYGNITQETDPFGQTTVRTYNSTYDQLSETDALGRTILWSYDNKHNKLSETNALGQTTNYSYDERGNLLSETDHLGRMVNQVAYDASGQPTSIQDVLGQSTSMSYASGGLASLTDALGNTINYTYTAGNMTRMVEASGQIHDYTYDTNNRKTRELVSYKTANGSLTNYANSWTYDAKGRVTSETINGITTSKTYGLADELLSETVSGNVTSYVYDANKKLIQTTYPDGSISRSSYDAAGNLLSTTDPLGRVTRYSYDALNRQIAVTHPDGSITRSEYDAVGNVIAEIDAQGQRTVYEYDALNRRIKTSNALGFSNSTSYDNLGRVASESDALGRVTQYQYDALNRRTATLYPNGTQSQTEYDALGRKVAEINPLGQRTEYRYNAASRLTQVIDALGQTTQYAYDQAGNKVSQTDALGRVTQWGYDGYGRMNGHILPNNRARNQGYDNKGRLSSSYDFNGQNTTYRYDANDRLIAKQYNGAQDVQHYDAAGQLLRSEQIDAQGSNTNNQQISNYRYDLMGRLIEEIKPTGDRLSYSYDRNGNKTQLIYSALNGQNATPISSTQYSYDALNRLIAVTDAQGSTTYTYDAVGNRVSELQPNGIRTEYGYNANNQVTYMAHYRQTSNQNMLLDEYRYTVDAAGQRVALEEVQYENGQASSKNSTWQYDAIGRLTSETTSTPSTATQTTHYQHDAVGNVLQKTISTDNSSNIITTYSYDVNDRLLSENKQGQITNYTYDNQGNTLTETRAGQTKSYVYNSQNQLVKTTLNGQQLQFSYDVDGIRNSKTVNGQVTAYVLDKTQAYAQVIAGFGSNGMTQYTYGDTGLLRQTVNRNSNGSSTNSSTSQSHYLLKDALGSTKALADATGTLTDSYAYDAYGEIIASAGTTANNYKFAGEAFDSDLGMYYNRARYYNQSIGRFSQMDSWQGSANSPITQNKYVYANANPVMYTDPSGNMSLAEIMATYPVQTSLLSAYVGYKAYSISQTIDLTEDDLPSINISPSTLGIMTVAMMANMDVTLNQVKVKVRTKNKYVAREVIRFDPYWQLGRDLTLAQAVAQVRIANDDVLGKTQNISQNIAFIAGGMKKPIGPEIHGSSSQGYRFHYHVSRLNKSHIFY